ncbi:MAG TPA: hypothetical protein P5060_00380 [Candidatus Absconditabacterales bacterium]|nr:hypothetical protein [Candidatus Absconditabacterales bacterium]
MTNTHIFILIGFLIILLAASYIKNRIKYIVTILSCIGILITIIFIFVPLYENGPNENIFHQNFETKIITYSKIDLNSDGSIVQINKKEYPIKKGTLEYNLKTKPDTDTNILFKSNKKYSNTFIYILFPYGEFVKIYPQSALKISQNKQIEIITGNIKYYPEGYQQFILTGKLLPSLVVNEESIKQMTEYYQTKLIKNIQGQLGGEINQNTYINKFSEVFLIFLSKIYPKKYKQNLQNFYEFQKYLNLENNTNQPKIFNKQNINQDLLKGIKEGIQNIETLK